MKRRPFAASAEAHLTRAVVKPLAPERCVTFDDGVAPDYVVLIGEDLTGRVRVKVELAREDAGAWWVKAIRRWLALQYGAADLCRLELLR